MKKINITTSIIIIILSLITIISEVDKGLAVILKDLSIIITITAPYLIEKIFKTKTTENFKLIWIIFIFMTHYLGVICHLYDTCPGFDKITHTISGLLTAYVAMLILNHQKQKKKMFNLIFIISFSALCAVCWEVFEFVCNILVGGDAQKVVETGVNDTMLDMIVALVGSFCFSLWYITIPKTS